MFVGSLDQETSRLLLCNKSLKKNEPEMWAKKNNRAIKFLTARPNGVLRGGVGSRNRRRPLKSLEEHFRV